MSVDVKSQPGPLNAFSGVAQPLRDARAKLPPGVAQPNPAPKAPGGVKRAANAQQPLSGSTPSTAALQAGGTPRAKGGLTKAQLTRAKRARARSAASAKSAKLKASQQEFAAAQGETTFEPSAKRARSLMAGPEVAGYLTLLDKVATDIRQGPVLPPPDNYTEYQKKTASEVRRAVSGFFTKSKDYIEFALSNQTAQLAQDVLKSAGSAQPGTTLTHAPQSASVARGALATSALATAPAGGAQEGAPQTQAQAAPSGFDHQSFVKSVPASSPDGSPVVGDLSKMSYANLGNGPNVWKLIMLMMNEKRMERVFLQLMQKQLIELNLTHAQLKELVAQVNLVVGQVALDRVMAMADFTQNLAGMPDAVGKINNKNLVNNTPTVPQDGLNAWTPSFKHQGRAPAAEMRAENWIKTVRSAEGESHIGIEDHITDKKDRQYLLSKDQRDAIKAYNLQAKAEDRLLSETFPNSGRHVTSPYLSSRDLEVLKKMDKYAQEHHGGVLNLHATYMGDERHNIQGIRNDQLSNRRDDMAGAVASRGEDFRKHSQAAQEAQAEHDRLVNLRRTEEAEAVRPYINAHLQAAKMADEEKGLLNDGVRTTLTYNVDSMETRKGALNNLQLGSYHMSNRSYHEFSDKEKRDPSVEIFRARKLESEMEPSEVAHREATMTPEARQKEDSEIQADRKKQEDRTVRKRVLKDLWRRSIMNHRLMAQKMHVHTHAMSRAGDEYKNAMLAVQQCKRALASASKGPRAGVDAAAADLKTAEDLLVKAKRNFMIPKYRTHRENRFRTGESQVLYEAMMAKRDSTEKLPVGTPEQNARYARDRLKSEATEDEFKLNSPPHQVEAAELFRMAKDGRMPTAEQLAQYEFVTPRDMERHCTQAFEAAKKMIASLEAKEKKEPLRIFEQERLDAAITVRDHAQKQMGKWGQHPAWSHRKEPTFFSKEPPRIAEAAISGVVDLRPAPRMLKSEMVTLDNGKVVEVRLPYIAGPERQPRTPYNKITVDDKEVPAGANRDDVLRAKIKQQVRNDLDHDDIDLLDEGLEEELLDGMETGGRMAITSYHEDGVEGLFNAQIIANYMQQLQEPFHTIQDMTAGDSQNAAGGAAALADDASNSVTGSFDGSYSKIKPMIDRLYDIMNKPVMG